MISLCLGIYAIAQESHQAAGLTRVLSYIESVLAVSLWWGVVAFPVIQVGPFGNLPTFKQMLPCSVLSECDQAIYIQRTCSRQTSSCKL